MSLDSVHDPGVTADTAMVPTDCARDLLSALRAGDSPDPYLATLAAYDDADLEPIRADSRAALAFWANCYNAGTQLLLDRRPHLYESPLRFFRFFNATALTVAGTDVTLDEMEHGILRGSKSKYGLGYLPRFLPRTFEMRYRVPIPDPRIHFVLNCGAESCPAIRVYEADRIDEQLDRATAAYLRSAVTYDAAADVVRLPRLFRWYRGDFGGPRGIRRLLARYDVTPADAMPDLQYKPWDWSRAAAKFAD
jgi:hypothetical protein